MRSTRNAAYAVAIATLLASSFTNAAQRAFVSSTGNDANVGSGCQLAGPCRTFQAAHTAVDAGGEILALDGAGYGAVTITKSVSIVANPGFYAGISASSGNAVTIATASINVRLSGIKLNGLGATHGISMTDGASLMVDNCTVSGFAQNGIEVQTGANVRVVDSLVMKNGLAGLYLRNNAKADVANSKFLGNFVGFNLSEATTAGTTTTLAVSGSVTSRNSYGFIVEVFGVASTARMSVSNSTIDGNQSSGIYANNNGGLVVVAVASSKVTQNGTGLNNIGSSVTFNSAGNNLVNDNNTNASGTITNVGTM
jgi:hypothetical protein